ncbi:hypothetical protein SeMB42_g01517 [Synchytrium endobioticum]|uniref:Endonuclease/exonuclease/phosphatase domain-containing protein n=1 Tax=Synchytrium endobioticum TaxID=286115 RepID=A0A507DKV7_9FUNG|nr:hypothetical protein SeMB42_g01517 [Synchytrium endobioticum]
MHFLSHWVTLRGVEDTRDIDSSDSTNNSGWKSSKSISSSSSSSSQTIKAFAECVRWNRVVDSTVASVAMQKAFKFTLMTFNVLAQTLIKRERHPNCTKTALKLKTRMPLITSVIEQHQPDILSLQEVDVDHFAAYFTPVFTKLGYTYQFDRKTGVSDAKALAGYGLCIAWKKDCFDVKRKIQIDFDAVEPRCQSKSKWQTGLIAQILAFTSASTPSIGIIVSNQHSYWRPLARFTKLHQAMATLERVMELKREVNHESTSNIHWHAFLSGDFNITPQEPTYTAVRMHQPITSDILAALEPDAESKAAAETIIERRKELPVLDSCYSIYTAVHGKRTQSPVIDEPEYTHWSEDFAGTLDYLFSVREATSRIQVEKLLKIPTLDELKPPIPNEEFGSDHLPLMAELSVC